MGHAFCYQDLLALCNESVTATLAGVSSAQGVPVSSERVSHLLVISVALVFITSAEAFRGVTFSHSSLLTLLLQQQEQLAHTP
jgi:hypothetical protein